MEKDKETRAVKEVAQSKYGEVLIRKGERNESTKVVCCRGVKLLTEFLKKPIGEIVEEYQSDVMANLY